MPEPALVFWILGAPFVLAIIDLIRTFSSLRNSPPSAPGVWSQALHIDRPGHAPVAR